MQLAAPQAILCELTHRCPLQCPYCSNPLSLKSRNSELESKHWLHLIEQAADLKVQQLNFSGGEPTLYPDYKALIEHASNHRLYTNLISSGYTLSESDVYSLKTLGLNHLQISFQGPSEKYDTALSKAKGAFKKKCNVVRWARDAKIAVTINYVITQQNIDDTEMMLELAAELKTNRIECAHVQFQGWAYVNRYMLQTSPEQLPALASSIQQAKQKYRGRMSIDWVNSDWHQGRAKTCMEGWGHKYMIINPEGQALPCHLATLHTSLTFDNIQDTHLKTIWRDSSAFNAFRTVDTLPAKCQSCPKVKADHGGCRCQAFQLTGSALNVDPACPMSEQHNSFFGSATEKKRIQWRR